MKKLLIPLMLFILLATSVFSAFPDAINGVECTNTPILNDTFNYSSTYISQDWDAFFTSTFAPIPPNTPYKNQSFGFNGSYGGIDFFHRADFFHTTDFTTGRYVISFDIFQSADNKTSAGNSAWWHRIVDKDSNVKAELKIALNDDLTSHNIMGCTPTYTYIPGTTARVDIILDLDLDTSHVYINNLAYGCANLNTTVDELGGLQIQHFHSSLEGTDRQTDNVVICQGNVIGNFTLDTSDTEDWAVGIENFWDDVGIKSPVSRFVFGLIVMIVIGWAFIQAHLSTKMPITPGSGMALVVIEFFVSILCVYIQLFPVWIIFIYIFLCGGIGFLIFKSTMGSGG